MPSTGPRSLPRILVVLGTRPEVIKLAPLAWALAEHRDWQVSLCATGQHRELVPPMLQLFGLVPEVELSAMTPAQSLSSLMARLLDGLDAVLDALRFDWVVVQGDTTTAAAGALAAFHRRVPVAHVEAGLRTDDLAAPFPEEANRQMIGRLASLHLAPTPAARAALLREAVAPDRIEVTGNTVVDAVRWAASQLPPEGGPPGNAPELLRLLGRPFVLVTGHRRESFGDPFKHMCQALVDIVEARPDVEILYPVHLNPNVQAPVKEIMGGHERIHLIDPIEYQPFVYLMSRSHLIITDSGGVQEEAPSLGRPVLVMRETTERPEALATGLVRLVGTDRDRIVRGVAAGLAAPSPATMNGLLPSPYGDGQSARRIVEHCRDFLLPRAAVA